ncbi:MAG: 16S rRNA (cytosine(1402)-N(4))-methyltransferase RsmH [Bacteroidota bacterium]
MSYHVPVMLQACLEAMNLQAGGTFVDVTFGGGGHSKAILENLETDSRLIAFDQDPDAARNVLDDARFTFVPQNFRYLKRYLRLERAVPVQAILADLGVSSHQIDDAARGFSYRFDAKLDMRMGQEGELSAVEVVNRYSVDDLQQVFGLYGEVRNARTLAQSIDKARKANKILTISDLLRVIDPMVRGNRARYLAQVFQAIRIEVNDEMGALKDFLEQALDVLAPGGRLVVMSYHSLEDRLVKNFLKSGNFDGAQIKDFYGNIERPFKLITKKAISAEAEEIKQNPRARSAKLRVGEKQ